jgi:hypothetical protein
MSGMDRAGVSVCPVLKNSIFEKISIILEK